MAAGDLTSVENVKQYLGLDAGNTKDDALLARLVSAASSFFLRLTGCNFPSASQTETRSGDGGSVMLLRQRPVSSVSSVTIDGEAIPQRPSLSDSGYVLTDYREGELTLVGYSFSRGVGNVTIVYTGGIAVVPGEVEQAVIELVAWNYKARDRIGIANRVLPQGESVSFVGYESGTASVKPVVEAYRRISFG